MRANLYLGSEGGGLFERALDRAFMVFHCITCLKKNCMLGLFKITKDGCKSSTDVLVRTFRGT